MNKSNEYQWELLPYYSNKEESAKYMYGKFLKYIDQGDYVGANLAKNFLRKGSTKSQDFVPFWKQAIKDEKFQKIESDFYHDHAV